MDKPKLNIYSDESRHLPGQSPFMVIGSIWCDGDVAKSLKDKVNLLKARFNIPKSREIKWTKVSPAKHDYYSELVRLFFAEDNLNFRAVIIPTANLRHDDFDQTEDEFYYKMQYIMMTNIIRKHTADFKIYLDLKDSWSNQRARKLASYLENNTDFAGRTFSAQPIRSGESLPLQLADLLIGAISYACATDSLTGSKGELVKLLEELSGQKLNEKSPYGVDKFNIFTWQPRE